MYKRRDHPKKGEYVVCIVKEIEDVTVRVSLEEYENFTGIIPIDEVSSKRISNLREVVKEGMIVVCYVIDVDPSSRVATLSLKRVDENRKKVKMQEYKKERQAYILLSDFCKKENIDISSILDKIIYANDGKKLYEVFTHAYIDGPKVLESFGINKRISEKLFNYLKENYNVPTYELKIKIDIYTLRGDGLIVLKEFLEGIKELGFVVKYLGSPTYYIYMQSYNPKEIAEKKKKLFEYIDRRAKELNIVYENVIEE
ncbi:S1 RNA-binding domain-containing protein [Nanoarchaeota archaeon NZ13-N]|uniref:S1 motif domain-containing protein n=1 Tax=Candidatus Nanoclepta minutus TaxID=1940235 RepID=A0A397WMN4_9ARCH|nr:MAG: S1 RNA-binding domain-containing protein [Nanoarchaeota archaeon NZ13-N]RIB35308.1 MAG: hypothetical protein BXU00_02140 [Candidatus Nanoclepta minutus]